MMSTEGPAYVQRRYKRRRLDDIYIGGAKGQAGTL